MNKLYSNNIDEIIKSVDGMQRATPSPFFYSKLLHKMEALEAKKSPSWSFQFKPAMVISVLLLTIVLNTFLLLKQKQTSIQLGNSNSNEMATVNDFSSEYNLTTTAVY